MRFFENFRGAQMTSDQNKLNSPKEALSLYQSCGSGFKNWVGSISGMNMKIQTPPKIWVAVFVDKALLQYQYINYIDLYVENVKGEFCQVKIRWVPNPGCFRGSEPDYGFFSKVGSGDFLIGRIRIRVESNRIRNPAFQGVARFD